MAKVDYTQLKYDDATGILTTENPDIQIELGAIGKGYANDPSSLQERRLSQP